VLDALTGTVIRDDGQVVFLAASKVFSDREGVELHVVDMGGSE
jgi:Holliday junction resolvase RusA-like endonuclease